MTLDHIRQGLGSVALANISRDIPLSNEVQQRLIEIGILDPPVDGKFGVISHWALNAFLVSQGLNGEGPIDNVVAQALIDANAPPLRTETGLAERLVTAMQDKGHHVSRHPGCINIVYVEGMSPDGTVNANRPNEFNDSRFVLRVEPNGEIVLAGKWDGTTEPGRAFTIAPENPAGAARIAFGQYKAWTVGTHKPASPSGHEALVQTHKIPVHRDLNKDFKRAGDKLDEGLFGINQHHGFDFSPTDIRTASAGCLVGRTKAGHQQFMKLVKSDPRFTISRGYLFMTAILETT
jgi:hypothetical protein